MPEPNDPPRATLNVRVQPSARRTELAAVRDGVLVVRVVAPAHEGQANAAVCRFLADRLGVRPTRVTILRGDRARLKLIEIDGIDQATVERELGLSA